MHVAQRIAAEHCLNLVQLGCPVDCKLTIIVCVYWSTGVSYYYCALSSSGMRNSSSSPPVRIPHQSTAVPNHYLTGGMMSTNTATTSKLFHMNWWHPCRTHQNYIEVPWETPEDCILLIAIDFFQSRRIFR